MALFQEGHRVVFLLEAVEIIGDIQEAYTEVDPIFYDIASGEELYAVLEEDILGLTDVIVENAPTFATPPGNDFYIPSGYVTFADAIVDVPEPVVINYEMAGDAGVRAPNMADYFIRSETEGFIPNMQFRLNNGIIIRPVQGNAYERWIFLDQYDQRWVNSVATRGVLRYPPVANDIFGNQWMPLDLYQRSEVERITGIDKPKKKKKKLKRNKPIPEIKEEKYYADKCYVA